MKIKDIISAIEEFAPLGLQEDYDNAGLLTGSAETEVAGAVVCVDVTEAVVDEAVCLGAGLVVAHHPIIFHPLKALTGRTNVEKVVMKAIRENVAIYAAHTNLDRARYGMSWALAGQLGLRNVEVLDHEGDDGVGFGAVGDLAAETGTMEFLREVGRRLGTRCVRHSAPPRETVRRVALITGSGGDGLEKAIDTGADVFLTADLRHDRFLAAEGRILLADVGHFESEFCAIDLICDVISKKIPNFALRKSANGINPVNYLA
ncbi:MAG: Nif3-like dinuclear metal center hexameric protein [Alistipes sp.]|jgi:dinuclear metal center YbgI/SA1388 family protein|nr:Nif3-like dinuclear metal center hexameric protein [Alistipes sp.]